MQKLSTHEDRQKLIEMQMRMECVRIGSGNIMVPFSCSNPDPPPRVLVAEIGHYHHLFTRQDLDPELRNALESLSARECFFNEAAVFDVLHGSADVWRNRSYVMPTDSNLPTHDSVIILDDRNDIGLPIFAIMANGSIASSCSSSRENRQSGEAWVVTDAAYRGHGLAARVVSAWASHLHRQRKTAFYSHLVENLASQAVARKLGATHFVSEVGYP